MNERNRLRASADGGPPRSVRPGLIGFFGRGRRRAAVAVVAAGAAALGAVLAFPGNSGPRASGTVATVDAVFSGSRVAGVAASGGRMTPAAVPELSWTPCDGDLQCATARVPLDYRQPGGAQISIQLIRHLATDPAHRIGSLFVNAGGPSAQVDLFPDEVLPALPATVEARYDIVTFDPRGFGHSTAVKCFPSGAAENAFFANTPVFPVGAAQQAAYERTFARFDALCGQRNGSLLDHDTSADVARDMDLLRQAVHDPVMNYLGVSYGTGIGEVYANLFPSKVGRTLLDASLDPVTWSSDDQALPVPAVVCSDSSNPRNAAAYPAIAKSAAARFGGFGALAAWADEPCAQWPGNGSQDRYTGVWNRPTANPILVFGNTGDVAVNFEDSVAAARDLGDARLLTINQFGHTEALNPSTCATNYEVSYLLTGALPPVGTVCQADASPFPAS